MLYFTSPSGEGRVKPFENGLKPGKNRLNPEDRAEIPLVLFEKWIEK